MYEESFVQGRSFVQAEKYITTSPRFKLYIQLYLDVVDEFLSGDERVKGVDSTALGGETSKIYNTREVHNFLSANQVSMRRLVRSLIHVLQQWGSCYWLRGLFCIAAIRNRV